MENTLYVFLACAVWGGVGGIVDAFFALNTHIAKQDFDKQYWPWYYYHPILGLTLGSVIFLILQAGLLTLTNAPLQEVMSDNITTDSSLLASSKIGVTALPIAFSFLAGFRQKTIVDFLTRIVSAIFQKT
jgi:H+/Cl- antiporter ClcA